MSFKSAVTPTANNETLLGRVKWFNNKSGYGFITVTSGVHSGLDIFVHHTGINVENQQYKYLVQGEYVNFVLEKPQSGDHEYHALKVNGINGGKLMCETRHEFKIARSAYKTNKTVPSNNATSEEEVRAPKSRGEGPRESETDKSGWTTVLRNTSTEKPLVRGRGRPPKGT
jgi:cold shock CspA family protein